MPFAAKSDVAFDRTTLVSQPRVVVGTSTQDGVNIQDVYDAIREYEDDLDNMDILKLTDGSGKEGIGGGNRKPPTIVLQSPWVITASTRASPIDTFTFDGGTLLSNEEAAGSTDPRSPFLGVSGILSFDRAKGQEGLLLNVTDLLRLRQWMTNRQELSTGSTDNFTLYGDDGITPLEVQDVSDKSGGPIAIPDGAPARRSHSSQQ